MGPADEPGRDVRVLGQQFLDDFARPVSAAIVDKDQLTVRSTRGHESHQKGDAPGRAVLFIEHRHHEADWSSFAEGVSHCFLHDFTSPFSVSRMAFGAARRNKHFRRVPPTPRGNDSNQNQGSTHCQALQARRTLSSGFCKRNNSTELKWPQFVQAEDDGARHWYDSWKKANRIGRGGLALVRREHSEQRRDARRPEHHHRDSKSQWDGDIARLLERFHLQYDKGKQKKQVVVPCDRGKDQDPREGGPVRIIRGFASRSIDQQKSYAPEYSDNPPSNRRSQLDSKDRAEQSIRE